MRRAFGLILVLIGGALYFLPADTLLPGQYARFAPIMPWASVAFGIFGLYLIIRPNPPQPKKPEDKKEKKK